MRVWPSGFLELFVMAPVQFSWPRGVAENWFTKLGFGSVLKRCVPKTLAFAFGLRLRSKTRCFKTRVLGRRLPNGKPQEGLRFRDLCCKTLAFKKRIAIIFCDLKTSLRARACVQVLC